mgnify:CR=1 FL=1
MLSFKDFLAVSYTGETEQQDLNAKKRHRVVGMSEDAAAPKEDGAGDPVEIGRAHDCTAVMATSRMPSSA